MGVEKVKGVRKVKERRKSMWRSGEVVGERWIGGGGCRIGRGTWKWFQVGGSNGIGRRRCRIRREEAGLM
jgi:hypothetical protein